MISSVMYNSNLKMGGNILRRFLMIPLGVFLRAHWSNSRSISLIGSGRGIVDGLGDSL